MHTTPTFRALALGSLWLAGLFNQPCMAAPALAHHATGSAAEVLALSQTQVAALQASFSSDRKRLTQHHGEKIYQALCQSCHMAQAQGSQGAGFYPALASNPKLTASAYPVAVVLHGLHGMPGFADRLSNEQVAEVINYVRSHFGNRYTDPVSANDVQLFRP
ncbi:cytochrome c [Comamonas sp. GB3 AK4-5]|uniref:c-type cytochrome n=1 Tax=Comamonas sp. GB3 AK4-5 TaxID=3231487 RepID=UPI00351F5B0C